MWGTDTKLTDAALYSAVSMIYLDHKDEWEAELRSVNKNASIHITKDVPHSYIKDAMDRCGKYSRYISLLTDGGDIKKSVSDGGVIFVEIGDIRLPLGWFETKSSHSCAKGKGTRGQATGLIGEQESRCRAWASAVDYKIKPLVAIMQGADFHKDFGTYNIDRIRMDLHTVGNVSPYDEHGSDGVTWLFYQNKFTRSELKALIYKAMCANVEVMKEVIRKLR